MTRLIKLTMTNTPLAGADSNGIPKAIMLPAECFETATDFGTHRLVHFHFKTWGRNYSVTETLDEIEALLAGEKAGRSFKYEVGQHLRIIDGNLYGHNCKVYCQINRPPHNPQYGCEILSGAKIGSNMYFDEHELSPE